MCGENMNLGFILLWWMIYRSVLFDRGASSEHTKEGSEKRIVGGVQVLIKSVPYQVSLQFRNKHDCGGSIISPIYIITAAHCTSGRNESDFRICANTTFHQNCNVAVGIKKIHQHQNYTIGELGFDYDISILELSMPLKFGQGVALVDLPRRELPAGSRALTSGWGASKFHGKYSIHLKITTVGIIDRTVCERKYLEKYARGTITDRTICAGENNTDSCTGDSGGPLVGPDNKLYGIVSFGDDCASEFPGVYTDVVKLREFINNVTGL